MAPANMKFDRKHFCREGIRELAKYVLLHKVHADFVGCITEIQQKRYSYKSFDGMAGHVGDKSPVVTEFCVLYWSSPAQVGSKLYEHTKLKKL